MKEKYEKPSMTVLSMNLEENIAASSGRDETWEVVITRNGTDVIVDQRDFGSLPGLLAWLHEKFGF